MAQPTGQERPSPRKEALVFLGRLCLSEKRPANCVFHRQGEKWIPSSPEVTECLPEHSFPH